MDKEQKITCTNIWKLFGPDEKRIIKNLDKNLSIKEVQKKTGHVVAVKDFRHALAPGTGDPVGFKIDDCSTQRNLNQVGIDQSKRIGKFFKNNKILIDQVLTSQWCRCKDTAKYAFKEYKEFSELNSTFQSSDVEKAKKQIKRLKYFVKNWNGNGGNLILVTHYIIITSLTDAVPRSGDIVITDKNFNVLEIISTN